MINDCLKQVSSALVIISLKEMMVPRFRGQTNFMTLRIPSLQSIKIMVFMLILFLLDHGLKHLVI